VVAEYRIVAKLDPTGVTQGKEKVRQDLRQIDAAVKTTGRTLNQAFNTDLAKLGIGAAASNARLRDSIDKVGTSANTTSARMRANADAIGQLMRATNPAVASQAQLDAALRRVAERYVAGKVGAELYARAQQIHARATAENATALNRQTVSVGQARSGYQLLGHQIQDVSMQLALGVNPLTIFAQQAGHTAMAVQMMSGQTRGFAAFMASPWGSIIIGAVAILGALATAYFASGDAAEENAEQERDNITAADALSQAQGALGQIFDLTTGKIRDNTLALQANAIMAAHTLRIQAQAQVLMGNLAAGVASARVRQFDAMGPGAIATARRFNPQAVDAFTQMRNAAVNAGIVRGRRTGPAISQAQALDIIAGTDTDALTRSGFPYSGQQIATMLNNRIQGQESTRIADEMLESLRSGQLGDRFRRGGAGGRKGGGGRSDPVADFFERLTQERDAAGVPPSLERRILETLQEAQRAFDRPVTPDERERIALLVSEIDSREILQRLTETYNVPMQRELALLGQTGLQREINNAIMTEEANLHRTLSAEQRILIENSIRWRDSLQRQQAVIESINGPVEEYREQMAALNLLLGRGAISQEAFNQAVRSIPLSKQAREIETMVGGMAGYLAALDAINSRVDAAAETIRRAREAGLYTPEQADAMLARLGSATGDEIQVGGPRTVRDRLLREMERERRSPLAGVDQTLGGGFAHDAERERIMEENRQRIEIIRDARAQELILEEDMNRRILASREQMNLQIMELDARRYQTAFAAASQSFGQVADLMKGFAGEHSRIYRAMFVVSKAFAIAESIVAIQVAIAQAMKLPFPANIPAIAQVVAMGVSIIANIQAAAAEFDRGGYTGDGDPRDVAGTVHRREFVVNAPATARNRPLLEALNSGATFQRGASAAAANDNRAGRGALNVTVHNYAGAEIEVQQGPTIDDVVVIARRVARQEAPRAVAADLSNPNGPTTKAMQRNLGVKRKRA
jgi:hypothetical protein